MDSGDGDGDGSSAMHVVIFPWLGFGHLLPGLELADRLAARGHRVSFVSTPRNLARLRRPAAPALVDLVALPLPRVAGLPAGAEATGDVPPGKAGLHLRAFDGLAAPFAAFLDAGKVDWLVLDGFHHWAAAAAAARGIPVVLSLIYAAATSVQYGVPRGPASAAAADLGHSIAERFVLTFDNCDLLAHRTCRELEPESLPLLPAIFGKPVVPIGLLPPPPPAAAGDDSSPEHAALMSWLDRQPPRSVVFAAFGSEAPLTAAQLQEIALGLELAGARFLLALRRPSGGAGEAAEAAALVPAGFEERTRGRGLVAEGWVPQLRVLAHAAVGAAMTHCGWSSTIEALMFGLPLVMLPLLGEPAITAGLMERRRVGVRVPRREDGAFDREGVAGAVRAVMAGDEEDEAGGGGEFAANAEKLQGIVADRELHERYIDEFVRCLRSYSK
ncbi:hypothetical protein ACP4OV_002012 [Aristida adscensionis]